MKKLLLPFLLPLVGFAAVKGYYWYQVKAVADGVAQRLSSISTVEYDGVVADFNGVAGVTGLHLTPHNAAAPIEIAALTMEAPSWTYFLGLDDQPDLPHRLALSVDGLKVDFGAPFFNDPLSKGPREVALGCSQAPGAGQLMMALGYRFLEADLELAYTFNPASEFITVEIGVVTVDDFRLQVSTDIDLGITQLSQSSLSGVSPRFGGLELIYKDGEFQQRRNRYCAELNHEEIASFVNRHVVLLAEHYRALGFEFSEVLEAAYRDFVGGGGEIELRARAAEPLGAAALAVYSPGDLLQAMDIAVAVNGRQVTPLALSWAPPTPLGDAVADMEDEVRPAVLPVIAAAGAQETLSEIPPEPAPTPVGRFEETAFQAQELRPQPAFHSIAVGALEGYVGQRLRILTHNGREVEGVLLSVGRNSLRLRQQLGNGEAVLPITFARIDSIEASY